MLPQAYVVHRTRERCRLRIRDKRNDQAYFEELRGRIAESVDGADVRVNPITGSVLVSHGNMSVSELEGRLTETSMFELLDGPQPEAPALEHLFSGISRIDQAITESSGGGADLRTFMFIGIMAMAMQQMLRGNVMVPAMALLWNAMDLAGRKSLWPEHTSPGDTSISE